MGSFDGCFWGEGGGIDIELDVGMRERGLGVIFG